MAGVVGQGRAARLSFGLGLAVLLPAVCACASRDRAPPPLSAPAAAATVRSFAGSPLSGPTVAQPLSDVGPEVAWRIEVEWFVVRQAPGIGLDPLVAWTRLVVVAPDVEPRFAPSLLTKGAVYGRVPDAGEMSRSLRERRDALLVATLAGALPADVTTGFVLTEESLAHEVSEEGVAAAKRPPARVALLLHRPPPTPPARWTPSTLLASAPREEEPLAAVARPRQALGGVAGVTPPSARTVKVEPIGEAPQAPAELALDLEGRAQQVSDTACGPGAPRRELLLIDDALPPGSEGLVVVLPSPFRHEGLPGRVWLLALARALPAPAPGEPGHAAHREAFAATIADMEQARALMQPPPIDLGAAGRLPPPPSHEAARAALRDPREQRRVLLALAEASGAELTGMLALAAERADIERIATLLSERLAQEPSGAPQGRPAPSRWLLERTSIEAMRVELPGRELGPAMEAVVGRFAGAVARRAAFLELVGVARDAEHLQELLVRENAALLDDPSPSIRARATEWLSRRRPDLVPQGFDPLGPDRERRAALEALRAPAAQPGAAGAAPQGAEEAAEDAEEAQGDQEGDE